MKFFRNASRSAALFALLYLILSCVYIVITDKLALTYASGNPVSLYHASVLKGLIFMLINSGIFYTLAFFLIKKIQGAFRALEANRQIMTSLEKRSMVGVFAASAAHDANNSLAVIRIKLSMLEKKITTGEAKAAEKDLETISTSLKKIENILRKMKDLTKVRTDVEPQTFSVAHLVSSTLEFSQFHPKLKSMDINVSAQGDFNLKGDPYLFEQAILNLLINAAEAGECSKILVKYGDHGGKHYFEFHDNGPGFSTDTIDKIKDGLYSTKDTGTGLGLLTVQSSAEDMGGHLEFTQSPELGGALVRLTIPC